MTIMKKLSAKNKKQIELAIIISVLFLSIIFWNNFLLFPIKMFVVLMHEIFHGLAAFFTGGKIIHITIDTNLGGQCLTQGGLPFIVASAGYLGSLLTGAFLFISGYNKKVSIWFCTILASLLLIFTANYVKGTVGIILALTFAIMLYISPRFFNKTVHLYLMKFLGLVCSVYVLIDIKEDLLTLQYRLTDAQHLADITGIPAIIWGLLWSAITITVVYFLLRHSYKKGFTN